MASVPSFYQGDKGGFSIPKDRFLQYTEDPIKEQFQSLDQDAINRLKNLPTIFATEQEVSDARIGRITDIEVYSSNLRVKYSFDKDRYPLTRGVLKENQQKLGISESGYEFHRGHWGIKECNLYDFYEEYLRSLTGIAHKLNNTGKKVQLIYAFNGTGKTRLSRTLKDIIAPKDEDAEDRVTKVIYYNAFTEDLFYWDNDLEEDTERKLKIQPNAYTSWVLEKQGQDQNAIAHFQRYTSDKLTPRFNAEYKIKDADGKEVTVPAFSEVTFSFERGNKEKDDNIKISKGEESNFIWSIFYSLIEQVIATLNVAEVSARDTDRYNKLEYVFIDDPVSSLDENHLIELAVNVAALIKSSQSGLKFIITTHNPLFYNVLYNELDVKNGYILNRYDDGTFDLEEKKGDSNKSFSYHLYLKQVIEKAVADNQVEKYHFTLLRNLYEKTANFLGYPKWSELLPDDKQAYLNRIIQFTSHSTLSSDAVAEPSPQEKKTVEFLLKHLTNNYGYWKHEERNG
ncbi:MAG: AAA family ATPase [Paludibacterium sp.]|nr:AAA family ATPase [Paludibacterium sp.]